MSTSDLKLSLVERLLFVDNKELLQRLHELLDKDAQNWAPTAADLRELDARRARRIRGESASLTRSESIKRLRARRKA